MRTRDALRPGTISPRRAVPLTIARPEYVDRPQPRPYSGTEVKDAETIERMRVAGRIAAQALAEVGRHVAPGVTTDELDRIGHEFLCDHGAYPSTLGYKGFPKSLCTSVNEVICHGIPDSTGDRGRRHRQHRHHRLHRRRARRHQRDLPRRRRRRGGRGCWSSAPRRRCCAAIKAVAPGPPINVIGRVIESYARRFGYGVVRDFTGHGIGTAFHSGLVIPHYDDAARTNRDGARHDVHDRADAHPRHARLGHVGRRLDRGHQGPRRTAQFEHTVLVTDTGAEILTLP